MIRTLSEPPLFENQIHVMENTSEIDSCFKKDFVWSLSENVIEIENLPLIGSWTSFNKMVTEFKTEKCIQEYMPVCPHPPEYPVCKQCLHFLGEVILDLEIPYIFAHSDEAV